MSVLVSICGFLLGSLVLGVAVELAAREVEGRLDQVPWLILRLARRRLHPEIRDEVFDDEWAPELHFILQSSGGLPLTRFVRGARFAFGLLIGASLIGAAKKPGGKRRGFLAVLVIAGSGICALASLSFDLLTGEPQHFLIAFVLAVAPVPVFLAAVLLLNRFSPEPRVNLVIAFTWGAGTAALLAGLLNSLNFRYLPDLLGESAADARDLMAMVGAPPVEETLKGLVLVGLLWFRRKDLYNLSNGIVYASMVGLGFAMSENVSYYESALQENGAQRLVATVVLRAVLSPFAHPLFTSLIGIAVVYAARRRRAAEMVVVVVVGCGWIGATVLHSLWNGFARLLGVEGLVIAYVILMLLFVAELALVRWERRRIVGLLYTNLPGYERKGLINEADIFMLTSLRRRRHARAWAREHGGRAAAKAMSDYQLSSTRLGLLHDQVARGAIDDDHFRAMEPALSQEMADARRLFPSPRSAWFGPSDRRPEPRLG
ncbi:PrsW family intramembrane metalloprotease [Microbispora cellulosiformans]|uniref:PrsW family intramembrane metalloprotease n=1 Tax=Microbispora cellulosiformans TaxID=2614688 RepID=A0A5J5K0E1_9ACTN|nr:PrsW family intramembrane metalloprotease [Microbispora cellulosiformans]KAA9376034.1 PrsW family intramembrane metalloprotease [Microbispora cellulosiformans]